MAIGTPNQPDGQPSVIDNLLARIKQSLGTIRANRWIVAAIFTAGGAFASQPAEARSMTSLNDYKLIPLHFSEAEKPTFQLKNLLEMSAEELEAKVRDMTMDEIQEILDVLDQVIEDAVKMAKSDVGDKLIKNTVLTQPEKNLFIQMAQKYGIKDMDSIKAFLDKQQLTPTQAKYLRIKFREILKAQEDAAKRSVAVRRIADTKADNSNGWDLESSARDVQKYTELMETLDAWEKDLSEESLKK